MHANRRGIRDEIACLVLRVLAAGCLVGVAVAAPPTPTEAQKALAAGIAAAASPAGEAATHRSEWSPGLVQALIAEAVKRESKDMAGAESLLRLDQGIASGIGDADVEALVLSELGFVRGRQGEFQDAIALSRKALAIQIAPGHDQPTELVEAANTATSLSQSLNSVGQYEESFNAGVQAVELATASGNELVLGRAYSAAGGSATFNGNHRAAIAYLTKALAIAEKLKNLSGQAAVLNNLGVAARHVFDYDSAAGYLERSLAIKLQQGPNARLASAYQNLGELALVQDRLDQAERYFRQSLEVAHSPQDDDIRAGSTMNLGLVAQERGDFTKALDYLEQGIALAEKAGDGSGKTLAHLFEAAVYVQLLRPLDAQAQVDQVKGLAEEAGDWRAMMHLTMAQGDIYRVEKLTDKARAEYLKAIGLFEQMRLKVAGDEATQADFADNTRYAYNGMVALEVGDRKTAAAFRYAELSKSRVLLDDFNAGRAEMARLLTPEEAQRNKDLLARLAQMNLRVRSAKAAERTQLTTQMEKLRSEYSGFRTSVYAAHPELALRRADPEPVSMARAAALLPDEQTAMVSYSVGEREVYAFVVRRVGGKPSVRVHQLAIDEHKLASMAARWRGQIAARDLGFGALAGELYNALVKPLQTDLSNVTRLIVSPDGPVWQIPFDAMQDGSGKFVAESYEVFYVPSATVLDRMRSVSARRRGVTTMLALGDPTGDLPEAAAEVNAIGKLYAAGRSKVLTGAAATEAALRDDGSRYSVIHIASHGSYDDAQPLYSYLAMAPGAKSGGSQNDGNLEAREIMDLHLNARLVILSGCETARGSGSGAGIAGMSWALFVAGAPATIASLWKVDSRSTATLMTGLHQGLAKGETTARALQEAKLKLLRNPAWRHPFYWAGFVGIGAGQ